MLYSFNTPLKYVSVLLLLSIFFFGAVPTLLTETSFSSDWSLYYLSAFLFSLFIGGLLFDNLADKRAILFYALTSIVYYVLYYFYASTAVTLYERLFIGLNSYIPCAIIVVFRHRIIFTTGIILGISETCRPLARKLIRHEPQGTFDLFLKTYVLGYLIYEAYGTILMLVLSIYLDVPLNGYLSDALISKGLPNITGYYIDISRYYSIIFIIGVPFYLLRSLIMSEKKPL